MGSSRVFSFSFSSSLSCSCSCSCFSLSCLVVSLYPCLSRSLLSQKRTRLNSDTHKHLSTQKQTHSLEHRHTRTALNTDTHAQLSTHQHHEPRAPNFHNTNSKKTTHQLTRETHTYEHEHKHQHTETNTKQTRPTTTPMPKNPNTNHDQTHTDSGYL